MASHILVSPQIASGGLSKLEQAATEVDALQKELSQARIVVKAATEECNQLLEVRPCVILCERFGGHMDVQVTLAVTRPQPLALCAIPSTQVISSNTADAETRQKAAQEKEESLNGLSAQIEVCDCAHLDGSCTQIPRRMHRQREGFVYSLLVRILLKHVQSLCRWRRLKQSRPSQRPSQLWRRQQPR